MTVRFSRPLTVNSRFGQQLLAAGQDAIEEGLAEVGRDAVRRTNDIVRKLYDNGRTGFRSKDDETKLLNSFDFKVERSPGTGLPAKLIITSSADPAKVGALEFGSPPHTITARDAPLLVFDRNPRNVFGQRLDKKLGPAKAMRQKGRGRAQTAGGKGNLTKVKSVEHPGNREGRFMRGGLEGAIRAAYRKVTTSA